MKKIVQYASAGLIASSALFVFSSTAYAGNVNWAVSVGAPAPVVYSAPAPVVYAAPAPVMYAPPPAVVYPPAAAVYVSGGPAYRPYYRHHHHWRHPHGYRY